LTTPITGDAVRLPKKKKKTIRQRFKVSSQQQQLGILSYTHEIGITGEVRAVPRPAETHASNEREIAN
jgi:hypothetical protein